MIAKRQNPLNNIEADLDELGRLQNHNRAMTPNSFRPSPKTAEIIEALAGAGVRRTDLINYLVETYGPALVDRFMQRTYERMSKLKKHASTQSGYGLEKVEKVVDHILGTVQSSHIDDTMVVGH